MIRHSPCEYYIKYLLTLPEGLDNKQIRERLERENFDYLGDAYIETLRVNCRPPDPFYPRDKTHSASQRFLTKEKIRGLHHPDRAEKEAFKILETPRAREFVESMGLSKAPVEAIAAAVCRQYNLYVTTAGVQKYLHYFWNVDLLDTTECRALIELHLQNIEESTDPDVKKQATAFKRAHWNDPRRLAADLPHSPMMALIAQMRMGVMPTKMNIAQALELVRVASTLRAAEAATGGGKADSKRVMDFMLGAKIAGEMLGDLAKPEDALLKQLERIKITSEEGDVPLLAEVSEGNYTKELLVSAEKPKRT